MISMRIRCTGFRAPPPLVRRRPRSPSRLHPSGLRNPSDSGAKSLLIRAAYRRMQAQASLDREDAYRFKAGQLRPPWHPRSPGNCMEITMDLPNSQLFHRSYFSCLIHRSEQVCDCFHRSDRRTILWMLSWIVDLDPRCTQWLD